jgi:WD40 repeat protein
MPFASDGRLASVGRDRIIRVWSSDGKPVAASAVQPALLTKMAASFNGKLFIAGDYEGKLLLWDGRQISTLSPHPAQAKLEPGR